MTPYQTLFANLIITSLLTGLIWYIQVVHYPIFTKINPEAFMAFHNFHTQHTGYVVAAPMLIELILSFILLSEFRQVAIVPLWTHGLLCGLTVLIWMVTFGIAVPLHNQLSYGGFDLDVIHKLVNVNWVRTVAWSIRCIILTYFSWRIIPNV